MSQHVATINGVEVRIPCDAAPVTAATTNGEITDDNAHVWIKRVILAIEIGVFDDQLEAILAAGHNRKEAVRTGRGRRRPW